MRTTTMRAQQGQAMSEFIVAMTFLFVPLFMGIVYIGKYGDIKHQAIQASRYAAMERALDPQDHESDAVIGNETVARFFRDDGKHPIGLNDQATESTAGDENPAWGQLTGQPMLGKYGDVSVKLSSKSVDSTLLAPVDLATKQFNGLNTGYGVEADVEVPLVNIAHFAPLANINLKIGASTVIAGDPWNGGGAADVGNHFTGASVPGRLINIVDQIPGINQLFQLLADTPAPQFGCVKPDVVPAAAAPGAKYNPQDDPTNPSNANDKCY
jgi:hypothetical protein